MRSYPIFFALLLTPVGLAAQSSTATNPTLFVRPIMSDSCPVGFSVDRRPQGAIIWTSQESDWIKNHGSLSLPELERAFKNESGFSELSTHAQQDRLDRLVRSYNMQHGQGLTINFKKPATQIVSADIVVHGSPASVHIIPATPSTPKDVTETFHLTSSTGEPLLHPAIWTNHINVVNWVELTRLDYADGTTWQASTPRQCHAAPSLLLLVDSAR